MVKRIFLLVLAYGLIFFNACAQDSFFIDKEKHLTLLAEEMLNAEDPGIRQQSFDLFYKTLLETLAKEGSYQFSFDSLVYISKQQPSDQRFRIFSGIVDLGKSYTHFGVLQLADGRIFELSDRFESLDDWEFTITDEKEWMGALYYNIMEDSNKDGKHYLLFGLHRFKTNENAKIVEVLSFSENGNPVFGKEIFKRDYPDARPVIKTRLVIKYDESSHVSLHYNADLKNIVHDHLIPSMTPLNPSGMSLVSDGSLVGYEKKGNTWNFIDKIFTQTLDEAPRPKPVLDKRNKDLFGRETGKGSNKN